MRHLTRVRSMLLALAALAGCEWNAARIVAIDATGGVRGIAYISDGDDEYAAASDVALAGVGLNLVRGSHETVAYATSDDSGVYRFGPVPAGTYRIVAEPGALGDSLLATPNPSSYTVLPGDTVTTQAVFAYRIISIREARETPTGARVSVSGVVLNLPAAFGDGSVYVDDGSGAIRIREVAGVGLAVGDSVAVRGDLVLHTGQPALSRPLLRRLSAAGTPQALLIPTARAAVAGGGDLDGRLVRIAGATTLDASPDGDETVYLVDDGSGSVRVRLRGFSAHRPGTILDVTGVLAPDLQAGGAWSLRARDNRDLLASFPRFNTAQVRDLAPGRLVAVTGVALSGWGPFGGTTVHLGDDAGAIRAFAPAQKFVEPGYRLELVGTVGSADGHRVLRDAVMTVLSTGAPPTPLAVTPRVAASADGGRLDAALVRVTGVVVRDTATVLGERYLHVVDSTADSLTVLLSRNVGFDPDLYTPGAVLDAAGLLLPAGHRQWILAPRSSLDLHLR